MLKRIWNWKLLAGFALILGLSGGGLAYCRSTLTGAQAQEEPQLQTAVVRRGDLILYASGTGTLVAPDPIELGFGSAGTVAKIYVEIGDLVQAGDILAEQADQDELQAAVEAARLEVLNAQQALDELYANAELVAAQAYLDLANAREALKDAETDWWVQQPGHRASDATMDAAKAELELAEEDLSRAKAALDKDPENPSLQLRYANAQKRYDTAVRNWNWYTGSPSEIEQMKLDAELALAGAQVAAAERYWEQVKDGPREAETARAKLELRNAQAQLEVAERKLEEAVITAPVDGTILAVEAEEGDDVAGPFIALADLSKRYVDVFLDETDIDKIDVGYEVEVTFEALPDKVFTGQIVQVEPSLQNAGQFSTIVALARLDQDQSGALDRLLIGMSAAVDVIGGRAEGVPLVPVEALREIEPGQYAVFVMEDAQPRLRMIEIGLMDITFAEVRSGLEVGEVVTTGIVEVQ